MHVNEPETFQTIRKKKLQTINGVKYRKVLPNSSRFKKQTV